MATTDTQDLQDAGAEQRWSDRFAAFADAIDGHGAAREDEIAARDEAIVQAIDLGWNRRKVARWARISPGRITQIIAHRCAE